MRYRKCGTCPRRCLGSSPSGRCFRCVHSESLRSPVRHDRQQALADEDRIVSLATLAGAGLPLFQGRRDDR